MYAVDRERLEYELTVRQEPKQARMCGVGGKADRRPIDPPPIIQLRVIDPAQRNRNPQAAPSRDPKTASDGNQPASPVAEPTAQDATGTGTDAGPSYADSFLQNPYYFMFASLAKPDDDAELHWLKDGRTRCTTGSVVSSLYHLKDPQNQNEDAGFFVFPDLSVRTEGSYRLKLSLFEVVDNSVRHCKSIFSAPFYVYTAKKFPGMEESTPLSCSLADQGIKIRIRKDIRVRKRPMPTLEHPLGAAGGPSAFGTGGPVPGAGPIQPLGPVPGTSSTTYGTETSGNIPLPPGSTVAIPPPPGSVITIPSAPGTIPPPPGATISLSGTIPPPPGATHTSDGHNPLPVPQPQPRGLSLPGVDKRTLPLPSAPGIGKGVVIDEEHEKPVPSDDHHHHSNETRAMDNLEEEEEDQIEDDDDDDDDEYREDGRVQLNVGRRNPSTRQRKSTSKRKETEKRSNKTRGKVSHEEDDLDEMVIDDDGRHSGSKKVAKKSGKGRDAKRQKRVEEEEMTAEVGPEVVSGELPAHSQQISTIPQQPYASYHPPASQWVPGPAVDSTASTQNNTETATSNGVLYDSRYQQQYYDQSVQPYQHQGHPPPPPPSASQYMAPAYPAPHGQYGYSLGPPPPPGQYGHQQYYQPGVQGWGPPPSINYALPHHPQQQVPVYGPPPPPAPGDPYATYPPPPQQQPQQQYQPRYDYGGAGHLPPPLPHHPLYGPPVPAPHPMQHYASYYDQAPHPPAPQQQQYGPAPTASPAPTAPVTASVPSEGASRGEYHNATTVSTNQRSSSPSPARYPPSQQGPPPPPPPAHHIHTPPQHPYYHQPIPPPPQQHYASPYGMYVYPANAPHPASDNPWGTPPATSGANWQSHGASDGYSGAGQQQQLQQQTFNQQVVIQSRSHPPPQTAADRIQLAPLRVGTNVISSSSPTTSSSATSGGMSPTVSSASASHRAVPDPFPVIQMRNGGRGLNSARDREDRDRELERSRRDERGKKNPLSIGSIISDENA